jgi:transposase-like protein
VGVRPDGSKELVALADGYRESTASWAALLRDLKSRGLTAPVLATADGALGFRAALRDVFPETREQACWVHKTVRVLDALPERKHEAAKTALVAISTAATRAEALDTVTRFAEAFAEWPKAVAKVTDELDVLLAFLDYPAEHHVHLRTSNPIESTFSTVRLRTRVTKGAGSRAAGLAMATSWFGRPRSAGGGSTRPTWCRSSEPGPSSSTVSYGNERRLPPRTSSPRRTPPPDPASSTTIDNISEPR